MLSYLKDVSRSASVWPRKMKGPLPFRKAALFLYARSGRKPEAQSLKPVLVRRRFRHAELAELGGEVFGRGGRLHGLVDGQNAAVFADVERPAVGHAARVQHAVGGRHFLGRIAQQREIGSL